MTAGAVTVDDVLYNRLSDKAQIALITDAPARFEQLSLSNPPRLVVDIIGGSYYGKKEFLINDGAVNKIRTGYHDKKNFRIVIDLNYPVKSRVYSNSNKIGDQVIVDIFDKGTTKKIATLNTPSAATPNLQLESLVEEKTTTITPIAPPPPAIKPLFPASSQIVPPTSPPPPPAPQPEPEPKSTIRTVVTKKVMTATTTPPLRPKKQIVIAIDPGHGGKDPGAISRTTGLKEKDVVLQIARRLKQKIDEHPGFKAILTRDSDIFIPLHRRAAIARRNNADLFISIHADAVNSIEPSGSSVYILSTKGATSQLAKYLESSENAVDLRWGVDVSKYNDDIQEALFTIQQEATLESSFVLAERTLSELKRLGKVHKHNVERANFVVLRSPEIPSMLVETAFISNPEEARKLASPSYQERLAAGIANGIFRYFEEHLPQHMLLGQ